MRYVFLLWIAFILTQTNSTLISFSSNSNIIMISSLLTLTFVIRLVKDSSEKERFKLNLNSNEDILQSLYYVLKYSKQHGSPPSHNDQDSHDIQEKYYRHHSKLLKNYYWCLLKRLQPQNKKYSHNRDTNENPEVEKYERKNNESIRVGASQNQRSRKNINMSVFQDPPQGNLDIKRPSVYINIRELVQDEKIVPHKKEVSSSRKLMNMDYYLKTDFDFQGVEPPKPQNQGYDKKKPFGSEERLTQKPSKEVPDSPITLRKDGIELADTIIRLKILELTSKDSHIDATSILSFVALFVRLNLFYRNRPATAYYILSEIKNRLASNLFSRISWKKITKTIEFCSLFEMVRIKAKHNLEHKVREVSPINTEEKYQSNGQKINQVPKVYEYSKAYKYLNLLENINHNIMEILKVKRDAFFYLTDIEIELSQLYKQSSSFFELRTEIDDQFETIYSLTRGKFTTVNTIQSFYSKFILQDSIKALKIIRQSLNRKDFNDVNFLINFDEFKHSTITIVQSCIEYPNCHRISYTTNNITKTLGYSSSEITGQSINMLMPESYRSVHSLLSHPLTMKGTIMDKPHNKVFRLASHVSKKIVPCSISLKINPLNKEGLHVAANMLFNKKNHHESFILLSPNLSIEATDSTFKDNLVLKSHISSYSPELTFLLKSIEAIQEIIVNSPENLFDLISSNGYTVLLYKAYIQLTLGQNFDFCLEDRNISPFSVRLIPDYIRQHRTTINVLGVTKVQYQGNMNETNNYENIQKDEIHKFYEYLISSRDSIKTLNNQTFKSVESEITGEEFRLIELIYKMDIDLRAVIITDTTRSPLQLNFSSPIRVESPLSDSNPNKLNIEFCGSLSKEENVSLQGNRKSTKKEFTLLSNKPLLKNSRVKLGSEPSLSESSLQGIEKNSIMKKSILNNSMRENAMDKDRLDSISFLRKKKNLEYRSIFASIGPYSLSCLFVMSIIYITIHKHVVGINVLKELNEKLILVETCGIVFWDSLIVVNTDNIYHALQSGYLQQDYVKEVFLGGTFEDLLNLRKSLALDRPAFLLHQRIRSGMADIRYPSLAQTEFFGSNYYVKLRLPKLFDEIQSDYDLEDEEKMIEIQALYQYMHPFITKWAKLFPLGDPLLNSRGFGTRNTMLEFTRRATFKELVIYCERQLTEAEGYNWEIAGHFKFINDLNIMIAIGLTVVLSLILFGFVIKWKIQIERLYRDILYLRKADLESEVFLFQKVESRMRSVINCPHLFTKESNLIIFRGQIDRVKIVRWNTSLEEQTPANSKQVMMEDKNYTKIRHNKLDGRNEIEIKLIRAKELIQDLSNRDPFQNTTVKMKKEQEERDRKRKWMSAKSRVKERIEIMKEKRFHLYGMMTPLNCLLALLVPILAASIFDSLNLRRDTIIIKNLVKTYTRSVFITIYFEVVKTCITTLGSHGTKYQVGNHHIFTYMENKLNLVHKYKEDLIEMQNEDLGSFQSDFRNHMSEKNICEDLDSRVGFSISNCGTSLTSTYNSTVSSAYTYAVLAMRGGLNVFKSLNEKGLMEEGMKEFWNTPDIKGFIQVTSQETLNVNALLMMGERIQPHLLKYLKTSEITQSAQKNSFIQTLSIMTTARLFLIASILYLLASLPFLHYFVIAKISRSFQCFNSTLDLLPCSLVINNPLLRKYWRSSQ